MTTKLLTAGGLARIRGTNTEVELFQFHGGDWETTEGWFPVDSLIFVDGPEYDIDDDDCGRVNHYPTRYCD